MGEAMNNTTHAIAIRRVKSKMSRCRNVAITVGIVNASTAAAQTADLHRRTRVPA